MFDISLLYELKKGREAFNGVFRYYYPRIMAYTASMVEQKQRRILFRMFFCMFGKTVKSYISSDGFHSYLSIHLYSLSGYFEKPLD